MHNLNILSKLSRSGYIFFTIHYDTCWSYLLHNGKFFKHFFFLLFFKLSKVLYTLVLISDLHTMFLYIWLSNQQYRKNVLHLNNFSLSAEAVHQLLQTAIGHSAFSPSPSPFQVAWTNRADGQTDRWILILFNALLLNGLTERQTAMHWHFLYLHPKVRGAE